MFNGKTIVSTNVEIIQGRPTALILNLSDGTKLTVRGQVLDFYLWDDESKREGWIHPDNMEDGEG